MLPMDRVELTAYRFLGGIGSCFTLFQSVIWLGMSITGVACKYLECGADNNKHSFGYCFYLMYVYRESDNSTSTARINFIDPHYFSIIMWINVVLSLINFVISSIMLSAFLQWNNAILVKKIASFWATSILLFSLMECLMCAAFIYDIIVIAGNDHSKCFMKADLTFFQYASEPKPAPYLSELKSNLLKLKKKIRKYKKDLLFLDVVVDETNSGHIENPFISKRVLNNHVKNVWLNMFNNNITDRIKYKRHFVPHDEIMKKFLVRKQVDLDEVDESLLKSFDSLTNIKWVKPVERSNVAIGTKYHLNANITSLGNETNDINQMAVLLHEYLKSVNTPGELSEADNFLDNITRMYLSKLYTEMQDLHTEELKNKFKNITQEINQNGSSMLRDYQEEGILFYLKQFFDGLLSVEQQADNVNENLFQSMVRNITELFRKSENLEIDNDQRLMNLKEYLRRQYDDSITEQKNTLTKTRLIPKTNIPTSSKLVKELCENCAFFALWPSIVCMLLSIKTGLVWFLNVVVVSLVLYYGDKIEIRRRSRLSSIIKYE